MAERRLADSGRRARSCWLGRGMTAGSRAGLGAWVGQAARTVDGPDLVSTACLLASELCQAFGQAEAPRLTRDTSSGCPAGAGRGSTRPAPGGSGGGDGQQPGPATAWVTPPTAPRGTRAWPARLSGRDMADRAVGPASDPVMPAEGNRLAGDSGRRRAWPGVRTCRGTSVRLILGITPLPL